MTTDKKFLANTIASISNLLNNTFDAYDDNITENDEIAEALDVRVALLDKGFSVKPNTALINKAMETTKSDPQIDIDDPLREIGEFIIRKSLLPTTHKRLEATVWKLFEAELLGSRRRHAHERDYNQRKLSDQILSLHTFISPSVIFPEEAKVKKKRRILPYKRKEEKKKNFSL